MINAFKIIIFNFKLKIKLKLIIIVEVINSTLKLMVIIIALKKKKKNINLFFFWDKIIYFTGFFNLFCSTKVSTPTFISIAGYFLTISTTSKLFLENLATGSLM